MFEHYESKIDSNLLAHCDYGDEIIMNDKFNKISKEEFEKHVMNYIQNGNANFKGTYIDAEKCVGSSFGGFVISGYINSTIENIE